MRVCADGAWSLSGDQRAQLHQAMRDAFPNHSRLERLLFYRVEIRLADLVGDGVGLDDAIFEVLKRAEEERWLRRLVAGMARESHTNAQVAAWLDQHWPDCPRGTDRPGAPVGPMVPPAAQRVLDSTFFDLNDMRRAVEEALDGHPAGLVGFGVTYPEGTFVNKICDWLACCLQPLARKPELSLRHDLGPVDRPIARLVRYRRELGSSHVVCQVRTEGLDPDAVGQFWTAARDTFTGVTHRLVLVLTGHPGITFPADVVALPVTRFTEHDVRIWVREVMSLRGWPPRLAEPWASLIIEDAADGDGLDIRIVYEALDRSINDVRSDPDGFRRQLEERIARADPPSR